MNADRNETLGTVRRVDSAPTPDRHPRGVQWPDARRPRPRAVSDPAEPVGAPGGIPAAGRMTGAAAPSRGSAASAFFDDVVDEEYEAPPEGPLGLEARPGTPRGATAGRRGTRRDDKVEANARLTGSTAAVLFVLLAVEGLTILSIHSLLNVHVFVGMVLVPPVVLKIGSTMWRFTRYYLGDPAYRRKGPPPPLLRLLGPVVIVLTIAVLGTGIALLVGPTSMRTTLLFLHKATFVVWLLAMAVHVLGHILDTAKLAPRDWYHRTRRQVRGAGLRQWGVATSVAVGLVLGAVMLPTVGPWLAAGVHFPHVG